jgi:manganese-dependent inorganic pyrophosphatase
MRQAPILRPHFVFGHRNPDTDAIVSAHVLAWMHRQENKDSGAIPLRLGDANSQTTWLFETSGLNLPAKRTSCLAQAAEIARETPVVSPDTPLREALDAIRQSGASCAAVCDEERRPVGIITDRHPRINYLLQCNVEDFFGTLLEFDHAIRGLPLHPLNAACHAGPRSDIHHLEVVMHKHTFAGGWNKTTVIVIGRRDLLISVIAENPPAAVIIAAVDREEAQRMADQLPCPAYLFHGTVVNLCARLAGCLPCTNALEKDFTCVEAGTDLTVLERRLRANPQGVLVVDRFGALIGSISADTLLHTPRPFLSLVDHSERRQSIDGLERGEVIEIVDHHRLGDIETDTPIAIDVRPLGSTATLLSLKIQSAGLEMPPEIARLLLGALISDTLFLTSPTTTQTDRRQATALAALAEIELEPFAYEVLRQNDVLYTASPDELVARDNKEFACGDTRFLLAQVETVDLEGMCDTLRAALQKSLKISVSRQGTAFGLLMVTDVIKSSSELILATLETEWVDIFRPQDQATCWRVPGMVSRKKQLLPLVLETVKSAAL